MSTERGKWAEGKVRDWLKKTPVVWYKFPDTFAGYKQPTPCDFMIYKEGQLCLVEVKEIKHAFRIPYKNIPADQIARMRLWEREGADIFVLIAFRALSGKSIWRAARAEEFIARPTLMNGRKVGSWDLSRLNPLDLNTQMEWILS